APGRASSSSIRRSPSTGLASRGGSSRAWTHCANATASRRSPRRWAPNRRPPSRARLGRSSLPDQHHALAPGIVAAVDLAVADQHAVDARILALARLQVDAARGEAGDDALAEPVDLP